MVGYSRFVTPTGNVAPQNSGGRYAASFTNSAQFTPNCAAGEYRQYVKGAFMVNGSPLSHVLCGSILLDPAAFREDGCPPPVSPGAVRAYGYRSGPGDAYDRYTPARATGCEYQMFDSPGFNNVQPGTRYSIDLAFRAVLVDTASPGHPLATNEWTTQGQLATKEEAVTSAEPHRRVGLDEQDRIVGAHVAFNLDDAKPELHIVVARLPGRPPLDPKSCRVEAVDSAGAPVPLPAPKVHEVGNRRAATATILFALDADRLPVTARLAVGGRTISLDVARR